MAIYITRKMLNDFARQEAHAAPFSVLRDLATSLARRRQRRRAMAELEAMDDATLRDVGSYRGDIRNMVGGMSDADLQMEPACSHAQHRSAKSSGQADQHASLAWPSLANSPQRAARAPVSATGAREFGHSPKCIRSYLRQ